MSKEILPDDLLKEALRKAQEMKTSAYDKEIAQEEEHVFSKEYREKMEKLLEEFENKQEDKKNHVVKKKNLKLKILLIAAIVMLMGSMTVMAVEPLRNVFYQFIEKIFPDNTEVNFKEIQQELSRNEIDITEENFAYRELKYIPEDYKLEVEEYNESICEFLQIYVNSEGKTIIYEQKVIGAFDTWAVSSDGEKAKTISINGNEAYWIVDKKEYSYVIYPFEGYVYSVAGYNSVEELIKIMEEAF